MVALAKKVHCYGDFSAALKKSILAGMRGQLIMQMSGQGSRVVVLTGNARFVYVTADGSNRRLRFAHTTSVMTPRDKAAFETLEALPDRFGGRS